MVIRKWITTCKQHYRDNDLQLSVGVRWACVTDLTCLAFDICTLTFSHLTRSLMGSGTCDGRMLFVCRMLHTVVFERERWERENVWGWMTSILWMSPCCDGCRPVGSLTITWYFIQRHVTATTRCTCARCNADGEKQFPCSADVAVRGRHLHNGSWRTFEPQQGAAWSLSDWWRLPKPFVFKLRWTTLGPRRRV